MGNHVDGAEETIILHLPPILILRYVIGNDLVNNKVSWELNDGYTHMQCKQAVIKTPKCFCYCFSPLY